mmetsp:Transcript_1574/g.4095  ORF Transcript_1574/g.4095 Transcript_1574/m.4095 type:complete len:493 (-) Transcript_1574:303-1781(-)
MSTSGSLKISIFLKACTWSSQVGQNHLLSSSSSSSSSKRSKHSARSHEASMASYRRSSERSRSIDDSISHVLSAPLAATSSSNVMCTEPVGKGTTAPASTLANSTRRSPAVYAMAAPGIGSDSGSSSPAPPFLPGGTAPAAAPATAAGGRGEAAAAAAAAAAAPPPASGEGPAGRFGCIARAARGCTQWEMALLTAATTWVCGTGAPSPGVKCAKKGPSRRGRHDDSYRTKTGAIVVPSSATTATSSPAPGVEDGAGAVSFNSSSSLSAACPATLKRVGELRELNLNMVTRSVGTPRRSAVSHRAVLTVARPLGTMMPYRRRVPVGATTSTSIICRSLFGMGTERVMNGSNFIEMSLHRGHRSVDLNWPWKVSTITESLRDLWPAHDSAEASPSSIPLPSTDSTTGRSVTRFRSSWRPSSRNSRNSCESCCWNPWNRGAYLPTTSLSTVGETTRESPDHIAPSSSANVSASSPLHPIGDTRFTSSRCLPRRK